MYMRIVWGKLRPGQWKEFEQTHKDVVLGDTDEVKGLKGRMLVQDLTDPDAGYSVSLWESREAMAIYETSPLFRQKILPALRPFFVGEFTTKHCIVRVKEEYGD